MSRYDFPGQAAAAAAYDNACDCCDHARRPSGPDDDGGMPDGWTSGGKRQPVMTVEKANRQYREYLAAGGKP